MRVNHEFGPAIYPNSKVLILGSMPSICSRNYGFYYMHPQNRFWSVISIVFGEDIPISIDDKKAFLEKHGLALWDVAASCDIEGSSDSSIRNVLPNDIKWLVSTYDIEYIFVCGKKALDLYNKYFDDLGIVPIYLPSTSPANRRIKDEELLSEFSKIVDCVKKSK